MESRRVRTGAYPTTTWSTADGELDLKQGRFVRIPERPDDLQVLWDEGILLDATDHKDGTSLPKWLDQETAKNYRRVGIVATAGLEPNDRQPQTLYREELAELERCGLILDPPAEVDAAEHHVYLRRLQRSQVWSIGLYELNWQATSSPQLTSLTVRPATGITNPILTRDDVTDVPAAFVADPFMICVGSTWHMLFEVLNWKSGNGEIGWATSPDGLHWKYEQIVLAEPFHLSYPQVFEWQGEYYLLPECHASGSVRLYRAKSFPTEWELAATLLTGGMFQDPTLVRHQDRWWLFVETSPDIKHDTFRLYFADNLFGPWQEHPLSPLRTDDPRHSRPAGKILSNGMQLVRFSQDCTTDYGAAVYAHFITKLTPTEYVESELSDLPLLSAGAEDWNAAGMHHLDAIVERATSEVFLVVVDGWRWGNCGW